VLGWSALGKPSFQREPVVEECGATARMVNFELTDTDQSDRRDASLPVE
jgi:hypothetical protein